MQQINETMMVNVMKKRPYDAHKGTCGKVIHVTGSARYSGACCIAALASMKSGTGMLYVCSTPKVNDVVRHSLYEAILLERSDPFDLSSLKDKDACLLGSGLGLNDESYEITKTILENIDIPIVVDGDALTILASNKQLFNYHKTLILTPHEGEFKRLCPDYTKENAKQHALEFAKENHCILVLKGPGTIITDGEVVYQNTTGNEAMASAGMGDVLAGMISSYLGQGYTPLESALLGVYLHGYCGDILAKTHYSIMATTLANYIPIVMKELINKK